MDPKELVQRYLGCLFGLAAGDTLGAPVEFMSLDDIRTTYGAQGIRELAAWGDHPAGTWSDDTQMALATADGCIRAYQHLRARGTVQPAALIWKRYKAWLKSQNDPARRRAPSSVCLAALKNSKMPTLELKANDSKGSAAVMRTAPVGLAYRPPEAFRHALESAVLTHGHPAGYLPAAALAALVSWIMEGATLAEAVNRTRTALVGHRGHESTLRKIDDAVRLATGGTLVPAAIEELGQGWVGDEALAIAVYCALKHPRDFRAGVTASVNHGGDSDTTGAVTGAILGAVLGVDEIPPPWINTLEDYDLVKKLAVDLFRVARTGAELSQDEYPPE